MPVIAVVGANWGDEGKGKITDYLAREADFVVRYQGGNNAGHTIINEFGKFALHLLPSGVFYPRVINVLGPGVAVNVTAFLSEMDKLVERGVPRPDVRISERAQVLLPHHILFDSLEEERLGKESFGSTKSGIAPFYADKSLKIGPADERALRRAAHAVAGWQRRSCRRTWCWRSSTASRPCRWRRSWRRWPPSGTGSRRT